MFTPIPSAMVTRLMIASLPAQDAAIRAQRGAAVGVPQTFEGPQRDRGQSLSPRWIFGDFGVDF